MQPGRSKQYVLAGGRRMSYESAGSGPPVVFLHGNPTSSFLWRNVTPHLAEFGTCIAPDLMGMGDSDKLEGSGDDRYRFVEHRSFFDDFMRQVAAGQSVVLVVHDWGGVLGFDWARRNPDAVRGVVYMETFVTPPTWAEYQPAIREVFRALRSEEGERMCLAENFFVENMLPLGTLRTLEQAVLDEYRRPFAASGESRRPTLTWAREVPIDGEPSDVHRIVGEYSRHFASDQTIKKLLIEGVPGQILARRNQIEFCRHWPSQSHVRVPGKHFLPEDSPDQIGRAIANWLEDL